MDRGAQNICIFLWRFRFLRRYVKWVRSNMEKIGFSDYMVVGGCKKGELKVLTKQA